ncbi:MAG: hypothetical protein WB760_22405 [Xanthobacteraceae bacterium]
MARKALLSLPKQKLARVPRLAIILSRAEARRALVSEQIEKHILAEDELIKQLLNLQWNIALDLSKDD